ncbi:MAG: ABC transporter permease [Candidatus Dormibacteria bacterium]
MMPGSLFTRELLVTVARPRSLLMKVAIPLVLTVPLLVGQAPTFWAAMLLTVLAAMTGAVGSAISVARARESGLLGRLAVAPRSPARSMLSWVAGSTVVDALQLAPTLLAIFVLAPVTPPAALSLVLIEVAVLFMANVLGSVVSAAGGGAGEVLIDVAVLLAPLLFLGGLFTGVPRDGWRWVAAQLDPFAYLDSAFIRALGGVATFGGRSVVVAACVTVGLSVAVMLALGSIVLRRR